MADVAVAGHRAGLVLQRAALVLAGERSCLSVSGREYAPATDTLGDMNVVTVDLSPELDGLWGDCARTYFLEDGRVTEVPRDAEMRAGHDLVRW